MEEDEKIILAHQLDEWKYLNEYVSTVAMPLSQMFDKVFDMIKSDMYVIKLQEKEGELSVLDTTNRQIRVICLRGKIFHCFYHSGVRYSK